MAKNIYVGVDLGGTKIFSSPVTLGKKMKILAQAKTETLADQGQNAVMDRIIQTIKVSVSNAGLKMKNVRAIGIGVPGTVNTKKGRILFAANLGWENVNVKKILEKKLGIPVFVDNDVNLGTFGEQHYGAARGVANVVGLYWGTGIGGGLIIENQMVHGHSFTAAELGHTIVEHDGAPCGCGNKGCLETFAAKWAIGKHIRKLAAENGNPEEHTGNSILKSKMIKNALQNEDPLMKESLNRAIEYLGIGLANIVNMINPQVIVLGGGVIESMEDTLMPQIEQAMKRHTIPFARVELRPAKLGDYSVLVGAAVYARDRLK